MKLIENQQRIVLLMGAEVIDKTPPENYTSKYVRAERNDKGTICPAMYLGKKRCGNMGNIVGCLIASDEWHFNLLDHCSPESWDDYERAVENYKLQMKNKSVSGDDYERAVENYKIQMKKFHLDNCMFKDWEDYKRAVENYKLQVFGLMPKSVDTFLFSPFWEHYDDTPSGAAARMRFVASWPGDERGWCKTMGANDKPEETVNKAIANLYRNVMKL